MITMSTQTEALFKNGDGRDPGFLDRLKRETEDARSALYGVPLIRDAMNGRMSKATYLAYLEQAYHHVKSTLPLLLLMASRIPKEKEWIRRLLVEYLQEEAGHDEWILSDIKNAGGDPEAVKSGKPSIAVDLMNAYNYDMIARRNPLGYLGMVFVFENASTALATEAARSLKRALKLGDNCFSYLNSHGSIDIEHAEFTGNLIDRVSDPVDQDVIIDASKVIYHLFAEMLRSIPRDGDVRTAVVDPA